MRWRISTRWDSGGRTSEAGTPIDASGELLDGTKLDGPATLRKALLGRREDFAGTVTEKLLTYALGRGAEYFDKPAIRQIVQRVGGRRITTGRR